MMELEVLRISSGEDSTPIIPSHNHRVTQRGNSPNDNPGPSCPRIPPQFSGNIKQLNPFSVNPDQCFFPCTGGGGAHGHPFTVSSSSLGGTISMPDMNVKYANVIIANKD